VKERRTTDAALLVQHDQLSKGEARLGALRAQVDDVRTTRAQIGADLDDFEAQLAALRAQVGLDDIALPDGDAALARIEPDARERAVIEASLPTFAALRTVPLDDEASFRAGLELYAREEGLSLDADPIALVVPPRRIHEVRSAWESSHARLGWDRWDYAIVGGAALIGAVLDIALVGIPKSMTWKGVDYEGSPLTGWMRDKSRAVMEGDGWLSRMQRGLEEWAKVPFDVSINSRARGVAVDGLRPAMHRIMSPGHDPVLGFIFGILDLLRGTCTLIDRTGVVHVLTGGEAASLPMAVVKLVAHLLSDIPTKVGLPPPFFTALQLITADTPVALGKSAKTQNVADVSRWMYGQGYDLRHFLSMSIVPAVVEAIVRVGFFARNRDRFVAGQDAPANVALKRAEMLTMAHALTASGNVLKVAMTGNNPLAINQAVWMSLAWNFVGWLRARSAQNAVVQEELVRGWQGLLVAPHAHEAL